MLIPQSLMCCNGSRISCSNAFSSEKSTRILGVAIIFTVCLTVVFIIHLESHHANVQLEIISKEHNEPTDLTQEKNSYGIIFDCGSSGTRVYIYYWPPHSGNKKDLLDIRQVLGMDGKPMSKKVSPGLSTYSKDTANSAEYLKPLLEYAAEIIPKHKHRETPLYILATAGMRLIPKQEAEDILSDITKDIPTWFDFNFARSHVEIIPGVEEGMYAWISMNYVLGRFRYPQAAGSNEEMKNSTRSQTVGVVDMGGGSLQIAFEVPNLNEIKDREHALSFNLGSDSNDDAFKYNLYTATFLGFGANSALSRYRESLSVVGNSSVIQDDCQALGETDTIKLNGRQIELHGNGNLMSCMQKIKPLLNITKPCSVDPCSIDGTHQPHIPANSEFYGISEYWYSTNDVLKYKGYYSYKTVTDLASHFCKTPWEQSMQSWNKNLYPRADMERMRTQCFKVSWVIEALHDGLKFPYDFSRFLPVSEIHDQEIQWSLGALIYKTRFIPSSGNQGFSIRALHNDTMLVPYVLVICIAIVFAAIVLYCRHLQKMKVVSLKSVPTMSYFMTDENEMEQGIVKEKHFYP